MIVFKVIKKIIAGVLLFVGIAFLTLLIVGVASYFWHPNDPPSVQDAPWVVQTSSRVYYAKEINTVKGSPAIRVYWTSDGGGWKKQKTELVFDKKLYGQVAIVRRTK